MLLLPTGLSSLLFPVCWGLVVAFFWSAFFLVWFRFIVSALVAICNPKSKTRRLFSSVFTLETERIQKMDYIDCYNVFGLLGGMLLSYINVDNL